MRRLLWPLLLAGLLVGCSDTENPTPTPDTPASATLPAGLLLDAEPEGVRPIGELLGSVALGDEVTLSGWVGGSHEPLVTDRAVVTVVDPSVYNKCREEACCDTPWDYCCAIDESRAQMASIRVVDAEGALLAAGLEGFGGLDRNSRLTVLGTVSQLGEGLLVVDARGLWVAP